MNKKRARRYIWRPDDVEVEPVEESVRIGPVVPTRIIESVDGFVVERIEEYNRYHDAHGRFASGGAAGGGRLDNASIAAEVGKGADEGGGSVGLSGDHPESGIMVSYAASAGHSRVLEASTKKERDAAINDFVSKQRKFVASHPDNYYGVWADEGKTYLDVSRRYPKSQRAAAIKAGRKNNQIAVFDLDNMSEIDTGGTGE